jgi:hypothetical protein
VYAPGHGPDGPLEAAPAEGHDDVSLPAADAGEATEARPERARNERPRSERSREDRPRREESRGGRDRHAGGRSERGERSGRGERGERGGRDRHRRDRGNREPYEGPSVSKVAPADLPSPLTGNPVIYDMATGKPKNRSAQEYGRFVADYDRTLRTAEEKFAGKKKAAPAIIKKISSKVTALFGKRGE